MEHDEDAYFILMLAILAVAGLLAQSINLPGIVGAFLAGLAVNAAVKNKPAKENLEFFGNSFFIPIFFVVAPERRKLRKFKPFHLQVSATLNNTR